MSSPDRNWAHRKYDWGTEACVRSQMAHLHQLMTHIKISSPSKCLSIAIWGQKMSIQSVDTVFKKYLLSLLIVIIDVFLLFGLLWYMDM